MFRKLTLIRNIDLNTASVPVLQIICDSLDGYAYQFKYSFCPGSTNDPECKNKYTIGFKYSFCPGSTQVRLEKKTGLRQSHLKVLRKPGK